MSDIGKKAIYPMIITHCREYCEISFFEERISNKICEIAMNLSCAAPYFSLYRNTQFLASLSGIIKNKKRSQITESGTMFCNFCSRRSKFSRNSANGPSRGSPRRKCKLRAVLMFHAQLRHRRIRRDSFIMQITGERISARFRHTTLDDHFPGVEAAAVINSTRSWL